MSGTPQERGAVGQRRRIRDSGRRGKMESAPGGRLLKWSWTPAPARRRDAAGQWVFIGLFFVCRRLRWGLLPIFHCAFEILDCVPQALAQVAQLTGTKKYQRDHKDDQQLRNTESSTKHCLLQPELHQRSVSRLGFASR